MFLAIVYGRLVSLEGGLSYPLQAYFLIHRNAIARHMEPSDGKLRLCIATIGSELIPKGALHQIFLHAITIPIGRPTVLLTQDMALKSSLAIP